MESGQVRIFHTRNAGRLRKQRLLSRHLRDFLRIGEISIEKEIQKAQKDIQEGKDELAKLEKASWYVFERDNFVNGYTVLETQCDKVSIIANIIPAFFIAIVVLIIIIQFNRSKILF